MKTKQEIEDEFERLRIKLEDEIDNSADWVEKALIIVRKHTLKWVLEDNEGDNED